jgi:hypothetical protein
LRPNFFNNSDLRVVAELKQVVSDLFDELARLHNGVVVKLEFRHGLPFSLKTLASRG